MRTLVAAAEPPELPLASLHWVPAWPATTTTNATATSVTWTTRTAYPKVEDRRA